MANHQLLLYLIDQNYMDMRNLHGINKLLVLIVGGFALVQTACKPNVTNDVIVAVSNSKTINQIGITSLAVSCPNGQQLVGGGYLLTPDGGRKVQSIIITGNYPVNATTWQVDALDYPTNGKKDSGILLVSCYCYTGPKNIGMKVEQKDAEINVPQISAVIVQTSVTASMDKGSDGYVVTSGGYKYSPNNLTAPEFYVSASFPQGSPNSSDTKVTGWTINGMANLGSNSYSEHVTIYSLSSTGLVSGTIKKGSFTPAFDQGGIVIQSHLQQITDPCLIEDIPVPADYFSVGGGYSFVQQNVPSNQAIVVTENNSNLSAGQFLGWRSGGCPVIPSSIVNPATWNNYALPLRFH
jgi:hypothetical protein